MSEQLSKEELAAMRGRCHALTASNAKALAYHVETGKPFGGVTPVALAQWLTSVEASLLDAPRLLDAYEWLLSTLSDPGAVWANMLRGTIARPQALDHYEQCKNELEVLQKEVHITNTRLFDLVRYSRADLHETELITDEEYAWLCAEAPLATSSEGGSPSPRRLEDYDEVRAKLDVATKALEFIAAKSGCDSYTHVGMGSGLTPQWVGCEPHRSADSDEWCLCCTARQALAELKGQP